ncbi:MAG: winged helix-turn-helix domain-containing protein [Bryobacteraceae bacterium]
MSLQTRHVYRVGDFSLDATAKVLLRNGEPVRLARKAVETLLALVEHPDQVLTKEELIESIWQGRLVDEANLMQNIAVVRRALQAQPGTPGYIETFSGRGYRLVGPILADEEPLHGPKQAVAVMPAGASAVNESTRQPRVSRDWFLWIVCAIAAGSVAALWIVRLLQREPGAYTHNFRRTAVARLGGNEFQPTISSDGANVAFVLDSEDGRPPRIWIKLAGQGGPFAIGSPGWVYSSPAWAPDGKSLAFVRFNGSVGEVGIASTDGRNERAIANVYRTRFGLRNRHLDWSPDGRWLAVDDTAAAEKPFAIYLLSAATGERKQISRPPENALGDVDPRFSPDGKYLSFIRLFHRARQSLFVTDLNGADIRELSNEHDQISGQDWTGDGKNLVFGWNQTGEFRLWRIRTGPGHSSAAPDWTGVYGDAPIQLSIARRFPALVYSVSQQDLNIWRLDLNTKDNARRWTEIIGSSAEDASPQYSPDGTQICFRSDRTGEEQLWTTAADGSNPRQVTRGSLRPSVGRWAPDGKSIVFNDSREGDLYICKRDDDGNWSTRPVEQKGTHPVFSRDGKWIYAGREDLILRISVETGLVTTLSQTAALSFGLSPDGKDLYFVRGLTDSGLWRLSLESGQMSRVLDGLIPYCTSCWAASSTGIYYLGSAGPANAQAIYFHNLAGGPDKLVAEYPEPVTPLGSGPFSLSPDGRSLLCVRVDHANSDVMRIDSQPAQ